jgi:prophage regulatory protein
VSNVSSIGPEPQRQRADAHGSGSRNTTPKRRHRPPGAAASATWAPSDRLVFEAERAALTGYARQWWFEMEKQGRAPKRIKLGPRRVGWLLSELDAWIRERAAMRDTGGDDARAAEREAVPVPRPVLQRRPRKLAATTSAPHPIIQSRSRAQGAASDRRR